VSSPDWVTLDTYIGEDFDSGLPTDTFWSTELRTNYGQVIVPSDSDGILCAKTAAQVIFDGFASELITGDVEMEFSCKVGDTWDNATTVQIYVNSAPSTNLIFMEWDCRVGWYNMYFTFTGGTSHYINTGIPVTAALTEVKFRITRTAGVWLAEYNVGAGWLTSTATATNTTAITKLVIKSDELTPGFSYFQFQADAGFPDEKTVIGPINDIRNYNGLLCFASENTLEDGLFAHKMDKEVNSGAELIELVDDTASLSI